MIIDYLNKLKSHGEQQAIFVENSVLSYTELADKIERKVASLKELVAVGEVVGVVGDYSVNAVVTFISLAICGCIVVPISNRNDASLSEKLDIAQATKLVDADQADIDIVSIGQGRLYETNQIYTSLIADNSPGLVLFSSGSTGKPKAMVHNVSKLFSSYLSKKPKKLVFMVFLMFDHIGGLNSLLGGLANGSSLVLVKSRNPDSVAALIEKYKVNVLPASPTFLNLLCASGATSRFNMASIRMITYGTEAMPEALLTRIRAIFPRAKLLQTFGTSETGISTTSSKSSSSTLLKFEDPSLQYKVVDGELWLKSETQVLGYLNAPMDSFTSDGWFKTGDMVEEAEDGFIKVKGRVKELINVGGEKVLPAEIESEALRISIVKDCMAYGFANAITGQSVAVDIVLDVDVDKKDALSTIRKHFISHLAKYKVPTKINFVEQTNYGERFKKLRIR